MEVTKTFSDPTLETGGVWVNYRDESRVKIARLGNMEFQKAFRLKMAPYRQRNKEVQLGVEEETRLLCECVGESILLDWEGFTKGGKPLKYSSDAASQLLLAHIDFREDIIGMAQDGDQFHATWVEEAEGN